MRELWRGNANAWECDELGHLNVKHYLAKAMEAGSALLAELGLANSEQARATSLARIGRVHTNYFAEARPGAPLAIYGGVAAHTETDAVLYLEMRHEPDGRPAAAFRVTCQHMETRGRQTFPWSTRTRDRLEAARVSPPKETAPRTLTDELPSGVQSLERADDLDLLTIGRGVFRTADVDAFNAARPDALTGRVSDSAIHLFEPALPGMMEHRVSAALLEARLTIVRAPQAGDGYVLRSGFISIGDKISRAQHWMLDPGSGRLWAILEGVAVFLDLNARKATAIDDAVRERMSALLRPDMMAG